MSPRDLEACRMFQPAEKACWEILLREYPDFRDVTPAALDSAMERTLEQLWAVLSTEVVEEWLKSQQYEPPLTAKGDCALNVLLPYFNTGQHALELVGKELSDSLPEMSPDDRGRVTAEISAGFKLLVHWQLQAACSRCHQAAQCRFGDRLTLTGAVLTASELTAAAVGKKSRSAAAKAIEAHQVKREHGRQPARQAKRGSAGCRPALKPSKLQAKQQQTHADG